MAQIEYQCDSCKAMILTEVDQTAVDGSLRWYLSYRCSNCGECVESDDTGLPPDEIREVIIQSDGLWEVHVDSEVNGKATIVKALRRILKWSLAEAAQALKGISGPVYIGTKVEAEWLQKQLISDDISSRIVSSNAKV